MDFFKKLGTIVQSRWKAKGNEVSAFPAIAEGALAEMRPSLHVTPAEVLKWLCAEPALPKQLDGTFSDFAVQVFIDERFYIELLFWTAGTTNIHQHSFAGAFHVLAGSSVHTEWSFDLQERHSAVILIGDVNEKKIELLRAGDIRPIVPSGAFIHSLFHLDNPSITVVVRTYGGQTPIPQYTYLASPSGPGIARDPKFRDPRVNRKIQCLNMLIDSQSPAVPEFLRDAVASEEIFGMAMLLHTAVLKIKDPEQIEPAMQAGRKRFGRLMETIVPVLTELQRIQAIRSIRGKITDPEQRFFLALLMNARTRARIYSLIAERFPDRAPTEAVVSWIQGASALEPSFTGAPLDEPAQAVLGLMLEGRSVEQIVATIADHPALRDLPEGRAGVESRVQGLLASPMLRALFAA